jgi:hypothetical protein
VGEVDGRLIGVERLPPAETLDFPALADRAQVTGQGDTPFGDLRLTPGISVF